MAVPRADAGAPVGARRLGAAQLIVSGVGLGCVAMSGVYGNARRDESIRTIRRAIELGVTFFDTADSYGAGSNEEMLGEAVRGVRDSVVLATKGGIRRRGDVEEVRGDPHYIRNCCEASLRRLGTDHIDLYYLHRVDRRIPIEETMGAMSDLVSQGKVRHLGLCEPSPRSLVRACSAHPIAAVQSEWSIWTRDIEDQVRPLAKERGIGIVSYCPLGRGFLTGAITETSGLDHDDYRRRSPRFSDQNLPRNSGLIAPLRRLAGRKGCTLSQLAIGWLMAQGEDVVPIPGTRSAVHLQENLGALTVELSPEDLSEIDEIAPRGVAAGARYPDPGYAYGDSPDWDAD
jgi:aryl-alcohol dehydrogenase-like predicted oxidoreductase